MLGDVEGMRVLDLFCGSGALGIEALSRGAEHATLVDTGPGHAAHNVEELGIQERASVIGSDAVRFLREAEPGTFDLVFCDPPYRLADRFGPELDEHLGPVIAAGGRAVIESSPQRPMQISLPLVTERRYGDTMVSVYRTDPEA